VNTIPPMLVDTPRAFWATGTALQEGKVDA
jgi:hypothetical protein